MRTRSPTRHSRSNTGLSNTRPKHVQRRNKPVWLCKSLIVPVDFSEESEGTINWAVSLAEQTGARVILVHVIESRRVFNARSPVYEAWDKCVIADAKDRLAKIVHRKSTALIRLHTKVRIGQPATVLSTLARSCRATLIVIGTHGFKGLKHFLLGSTTEHVVRHAPVPVLVVRQPSNVNTSTPFKPKSILVPTDFSKCSIHAMNVAMKFAKQLGADLQILHVLPSICGLRYGTRIEGALLNADLRKARQEELDTLIKTLSAKCINSHTLLRHGDPGRQIAFAAEDLRSDLIIISTHGRTGLQRALLGSTTEKVVRHAHCPVLVVPAAARED